ncbi:LytTR family DNA-binding domain-containing protein [Erythrobacter rubeus]|uniref:LytTR family transcriptional regulator n=1 Tax=Erythrobacter rubeus TaxID=2760803 RepID=A0ABR8KQ99_9SPHN|nr:LytTR family DNA-binding domain-containing protein [Erythrobacter rubeus]MBD2842912.1 LytTR family transcriptional regulator [Erythrobacter rubeus]
MFATATSRRYSIALVGLFVGLALVYAGQCWLSATAAGLSVGPKAPFRWGLIAGLLTTIVIVIGYRQRRRLSSMTADCGSQFVAAVFIFSTTIVGYAAAHLLAAAPGTTSDALRLITYGSIDRWPVAALAAAVALLLVRVHAMSVEPSIDAAAREASPWITFPSEPKLRLHVNDLICVRSAGNYCEVRSVSRAYLVRATMRQIAEMLVPFGFVQVHRSAIVNAARVCSVERQGKSGAIAITLDTGERLPLSLKRLGQLDDALSRVSSQMGLFRP